VVAHEGMVFMNALAGGRNARIVKPSAWRGARAGAGIAHRGRDKTANNGLGGA